MAPSPVKGNSIFRFLVVAFALWLCNSFSYGQERPLSGWGRFRSASKSPEGTPKEIRVPKISVGVPVPDTTANYLSGQEPFSNCDKPCTWTGIPWPFTGISLDLNSGVIAGTPDKTAEAHITVVATSQDGTFYQAPVFIQVSASTITVTTVDLPAYPAGEQIEEFLQAEGGSGSYVWTRVEGSPLPDGVTLDANGRLSGKADAPKSYKFKATVKDTKTVTPTATRHLELVINSAPNPGSASPAGQILRIPIPVGRPVTDEIAKALLTPANQSNPFRDCIDGGCKWSADPWPFEGIGLERTSGAIFGTPTAPGQALVKIVADDQTRKFHHEAQVFIEVVPAKPVLGQVTVATTILHAYSVGDPIEEFLEATGGKGPYLWARVDPPALPKGVTLDANGRLSGTATAAGKYPFDAKVTDMSPVNPTGDQDLELVIDTAPDCGNKKYNTTPTSFNYFNGWFPLSRSRDTDPLGHNSPAKNKNKKQLPTENDVQCFYNTSSMVSALGKVQYLYGFDGGANTLAADLVSVQMPAPVGVQVSFGSSVTGGGTGKPSSSSNPGQAQPNVSAALQSVEAGGNFYTKALYPIGIYNKPHLSTSLYAAPKMGFSFNGFASQATLSQGTEQYFSIPVEAYAQYQGIGNLGGVYITYRGGFESVPGSFARNAGLSHHNFLLQQFAFGFDFGAFRIGAQRFIGPAAAFNAATTSADSFNKWHLVIQMSPKGGG